MIYKDIINYSKGWNNVSDQTKLETQDSYRGEVGRVLLGEAVDKNDLLYPVLTSLGTVKEWKQCDANVAGYMPGQAIALEDGSDGQRIKALFRGFVKDQDFDYGTRATGTITLSGTVTEGDKIVLGEKLHPYCLMFTAAAGTSSTDKIAATATLTTTGIPVNGETITIDDVVFEVTEGEDIAAGSDFAIDCSAGLTQTVFESAIEAALDQAIAGGRLDISYVAFTGNDCVITLGGYADSYVGLEQNDVATTEDCTNAEFGATTFLGGVPAVNYEMAGTLTIAAAKVLLTAGITWAIANGLDITQADWSTNDLVLTAGDDHKGYKGNNLQMAEVDLAGTLDAGSNLAVSGTAFSGGVEGGILWASEDKGLMTLTRPYTAGVKCQQVGYAVEADKFFFNPNPVENEYKGSSITFPAAAGVTNTGGDTNEAYQWINENGELVTDLFIDITSLKGAGNTARDVIGTAAASYLMKNTVATYGYITRIEMTCLELPAGCGSTVDIDLEAEAAGDIQVDGACSDEVLIASGGWSAGKKVVSDQLIVADRYIYLTEGDTNGDNTAFTAGQFHIRFIANNMTFGR